jgi:hypothetical protein
MCVLSIFVRQLAVLKKTISRKYPAIQNVLGSSTSKKASSCETCVLCSVPYKKHEKIMRKVYTKSLGSNRGIHTPTNSTVRYAKSPDCGEKNQHDLLSGKVVTYSMQKVFLEILYYRYRRGNKSQNTVKSILNPVNTVSATQRIQCNSYV